ncbi:MAG TPA: hypothetical protein V6D19_05400 [Stenomitos sp.]
MDNELLNSAIVVVYNSVRECQIQITPAQLESILPQLDAYNDFNPDQVNAGVCQINKTIPVIDFGNTDYGTPNPNNGRVHHHFLIGVEGSTVLYLQIRKAYMPKNFNYEKLEAELKNIAQFMKADEYWITNNDQREFIYRFWWD